MLKRSVAFLEQLLPLVRNEAAILEEMAQHLADCYAEWPGGSATDADVMLSLSGLCFGVWGGQDH